MLSSLQTARDCLVGAAPEEALRHAQEAASKARAAGDVRGAAEAVSVASSAHIARGCAVEADQILQNELATCRAAGHKAAEATLLWAQSGVKLALGAANEALALAREGGALLQRSGLAKDYAKLSAQLVLARANAHLAGSLPDGQGAPPAAAALQAAGEALALSRRAGDEAGQGEALHIVCLVYLLQGRQAATKAAQQVSSPEAQPLSSLQSSNEATVLLRRLGNKEGEAAALLFGIAEARMEQQNYLEALGAAKRAQDIFRDLGHRRGRQAALETLARAHLASGPNTLAVLDMVEAEVRKFQSEGDVAGQLFALRTLADSYITAKMYGEALSAARRALELVKQTASREGEVRQLLVVSQMEDLLGRTESALKTAQRALAVANAMQAGNSSLAAEARRAVSRLQTKCGRPEEAPNRRDALEALRELGRMAQKRDADGFKAVMDRLENLSGSTEQDVRSALSGEDDPDREGLVRFLRQQGHGPSQGSAGKGPSTLMKGLNHTLLYLSFRVGGLGYGPCFRRCNGYKIEGAEDHAAAYLRLLSSQEEWGKQMCTQPTILDSMQHSLNAVHML
eukprot:gb/GFBE01024446.1/.p1 GENE.gb/GFBE01024446.1/~~gb/GFBE01024446.1/.p1  ORF type:complete len:570 (+),score=124.83 gb/GFBE01024446.1/:1-1710(+)